VKSIALELPNVRCRAVDLDGSEPACVLAGWLQEELAFHGDQIEVGRRNNARSCFRTAPHPFTTHSRQVELTPESVLLLTGGARGITAAIGMELARRYRPTLILAGRSPMPGEAESACTAGMTGVHELKGALIEECRARAETPHPGRIESAYARLLAEREIRLTLRAMKAAGATIEYHQIDVCDEVAVNRLIDGIYSRRGRLHGLIHGAGIIEDGLVIDKDISSSDRVFETKVHGALAVLNRLRPESLKFAAFFSSVAGAFGNSGQADYAAANEALNKLAAGLDRLWPARIVSINWGPWAEIGMASPEVQQKFVERKVQLIVPEAGKELFMRELEHGVKGDVEVILGSGPWSHAPAREHSKGLPFIASSGLSSSNGHGMEAVYTLDPEAGDGYLQHHQLDSRPVLPAAFALELMAELARAASPESQITAVRDFRVLNGVILKKRTMPLRIMAAPQPQSGCAPCDCSWTATIYDPAGDVKCYQTSIDLSNGFAEPGPSPFRLDGLQAFPLSLEAAYGQMLFHGPMLQAIVGIRGITHDGISATLAPSSPSKLLKKTAESGWLIDPVIVDGVFQMAILWARRQMDITVLPVRFSRLLLFGPLSGAEVRCDFKAHINNGNHAFEAQIAILNEKDQLLALIEGMEFSGSRSLNRLSGRTMEARAE